MVELVVKSLEEYHETTKNLEKELRVDKLAIKVDQRYFNNEMILIGSLKAYLSQIVEKIEVYDEYAITTKKSDIHPKVDFLLRYSDEKTIVEVKTVRGNLNGMIRRGKEQLYNYLIASGIKNGVLYLNEHCSIKYSTKSEFRIIEGIKYSVFMVYPIIEKDRIS